MVAKATLLRSNIMVDNPGKGTPEPREPTEVPEPSPEVPAPEKESEPLEPPNKTPPQNPEEIPRI